MTTRSLIVPYELDDRDKLNGDVDANGLVDRDHDAHDTYVQALADLAAVKDHMVTQDRLLAACCRELGITYP